MQSFDIHPGQEYGYRDSPKRRDDLQRVKVIEKVPLGRNSGAAIVKRRAVVVDLLTDPGFPLPLLIPLLALGYQPGSLFPLSGSLCFLALDSHGGLV
jgi:hypothetical protein